MPKLNLDHIAIAADTLEEGVAYLERKLGFEIPLGGEHPKMGTHNCLLHLGDVYLEVIAINPNAAAPSHPRWFNLDNRKGAPAISTWIVNTNNIGEALNTVADTVGPAIEMSRGDLNWRISVPEDGTMPMDGFYPTVIEWPRNVHPVANMKDFGLELERFIIKHPKADFIKQSLEKNFNDQRVKFQQDNISSFEMVIKTPKGSVALS